MATILFCEDNPRIQRLFAAALEPFGHRVLAAVDGPAALRLLEETTPDLVITDYAMPGMSGIELLRALRGRPELEQVPVALLSASTEADRRQEALAAGAAAFLVKPFSPEEMLREIESLLGGRRR